MGTASKYDPFRSHHEKLKNDREVRMMVKRMKMKNPRRSPRVMRKVRRALGYKLWS